MAARDTHDHASHDATGPAGRSFDERARDWDDEAKVERGRGVAALVRSVVTPTARTRVLEYGAGTGLATQFLAAGPLGPATLADTSAGMREVMREKVADGRLPRDARIWDLDLESDDVPDERFDLVLTVMALHHVGDPSRVLTHAAELLDDSGYLCIVDLDAEDGSFHADTDFEVHDGFARDVLGRLLVAAGFTDVALRDAGVMEKDGSPYSMFLASARPHR